MTADFKPEELCHFLRQGDRRLHPFFVGREAAMAQILALVQEVVTTGTELPGTAKAKGLMQVIQGAPGIGKTALLDALYKTCMTTLTRMDAGVRIMPLIINDPKNLSLPAIYQAVQDQLTAVGDHIGHGPIRRFFRRSLGRLQAGSVMGTGISLKPADAALQPQIPKGWAVLLMIDEIQQADPNPQGTAAAALVRLEGGSDGLPILPVLAGLSNSQTVLRAMGLSRLSSIAVQPLTRLTQADVSQALHQFINRYNVSVTLACQDLWARTLWRWSQGWPKHMQNGLSAIGHALLQTNGNLDAVDLLATQRRAADTRTSYYWTRLDTWQDSPQLMGQVMAGLGREPLPRHDIMSHVQAIWRADPNRFCPVPEWDDMLRLGLIDLDRITARAVTYSCPIPSLRSFAVTRTGLSLHCSALDGDIDMIRSDLKTGLDVNGLDAWGRTPMHIAAQESWPTIIVELQAAGAAVQAQDRWGRTPLHLAAQANAEQGLGPLLDFQADLHAIDHDGDTPLHYAARTDSARTMMMLIKAGANPQIRNHDGQRAIDITSPVSTCRSVLSGLPDNS